MKTTFKAIVLAASLSLSGSVFAYDLSSVSDLTLNTSDFQAAAMQLVGVSTDAVAVIRQNTTTGANSATIDQTGAWGVAGIDQSGDNGVASITQDGTLADSANMAYIMQSGTGDANTATISQIGVAGVAQTAFVMQAGGGNTATINQH